MTSASATVKKPGGGRVAVQLDPVAAPPRRPRRGRQARHLARPRGRDGLGPVEVPGAVVVHVVADHAAAASRARL